MLKLKQSCLLSFFAILLFHAPVAILAQSKPLFRSPVVTSRTPNHTIKIDVNIRGKKQLYLVVTDGGDGDSCDWANWVEPVLIGKNKTLKLTSLKWKKAKSGWGRVLKNRNANNQTMSIADREVPFGIGTHANSLIVFDLPEGYERFQCKAGLDNGGTDQQNGNATSVRFLVFTEKPPKRLLASMQNGRQADKGSRMAKDALAGLDVAEGLKATLFAAEPMLLSPTNIDIDHRGRVWVCEVVNYRGRNGTRKNGDRILILEDTDGDGVADTKKVYHQGHDVDSAMGICVLGNKVIVSCSPNVWIFTDLDGDDKPDKKEVLFTKTGRPQHDHSAHAFVYGPDGKLYWNFGNMGKAVHDKNGKPVIDMTGNRVVDNGKPYYGGMVFRCNPDGTEFEVLAHNFRNNYEVAVDSFGTIWQSDNDDDGNRGVRINYVMEHGNYGYLDEKTGAGWRTPRTGMHTKIPLKHWHLRDPGVVPNLLQTGGGSPTGIMVYEGNLLPKRFHNQIIHADAGPNVVRAYPVVKDGAGYKATLIDILKGTRDKWFRPSDVCVAPDGSIFIADWYDPGVGGHGMGDVDRGRIFRIAPPKFAYQIPKYDLKTIEGASHALQNPNQAVRYLATQTLLANQNTAARFLWKQAQDEKMSPRHRARILWLLAQMKVEAQKVVNYAIRETNSDFRILGLRVARSRKLDVAEVIEKLVMDESPQVRRECAISLRNCSKQEIPALWAKLAKQHDGKDRWYLEALGIAADNQWDDCLKVWMAEIEGNWNTSAARDILWRSRAWITPEFLAMLISNPKTPASELPRYFRAYDFQQAKYTESSLLQLAFETKIEDASRRRFITTESLKRVPASAFVGNAAYQEKRDRFLPTLEDKSLFVELVGRWNLKGKYPALLEIARQNPMNPEGIAAVRLLLAKNELELFRKSLRGEKLDDASATIVALGYSADGRAVPLLIDCMNDKQVALEVRRAAVKSLCRFKQGTNRIITAMKQNKLEKPLQQAAAAGLHSARWRDVKFQAQKFFPLPAAKDAKPLPPLSVLLKSKGDSILGRVVFNTTGTCAKCHQVNGIGKQVGPDLSEIGSKLSKEAMFESILYPSAGISHNYETFLLLLDSGTTVTGVLTNRTKDSITLKDAEAIERTFKTSEIEATKKQNISLMPADLQKTMSAEELVNVISYLQTLKKKKPVIKDTSQSREESSGKIQP